MNDFIDQLNQVLFWVAAVLLAWNAYILIFNKGVPNIRTAPQTRKKIIETLHADCARRGGGVYNIVDLGSGNGGFTRDMARGLPQANVIGVEISKKSFLWSRFAARILGFKNLSYARSDFFAYDLSNIDAVVFYLSRYEMGRLGEKLNKEAKAGAIIISNRFQLGDGWVPAATIEAKTLYPFEKEFHVYYK